MRHLLYEQPLEPEDVWQEEPAFTEDWRNPSEDTLREFAEENHQEFIDYIAGYDLSLLFDFAMDNRMDFREFTGER